MLSNQSVLWLGKKQSTDEIKHDACWDDVMEQPDPDCSVCGGSGYLFNNAQNRIPKQAVIYMQRAHGFQGGAGTLHTVAGKQYRVDATMWMSGEVGEEVEEDDIIIFPYSDYETNVEYTVISKIPYHVWGDRPFVIEFMLFKSIRPEYLTDEGIVP